MTRLPDIIPIRDAQIAFGIWPWSKGPLWRLTQAWHFKCEGVEFCIPSGYEFDKASIPAVLWGPPFNYIPDGLCTLGALEHDFLCDIFNGGSDWLRMKLGAIPKSPTAAVIHKHFYDRLLEAGVRPSKAKAMYSAVRNFGPGGRLRPSSWFRKN
jgi:hypothetical protein